MSLLRLLELNRSVEKNMELPDYKMAKPLPKFAPAKRSVSLAPEKQNKTETKVMNTPSLFEQGEPIIARKGEPGPGVLSVGVMTNPAPAAADPSEGLLGKLKRIFSRKKTVAPARPVQTEWSLDKVTVVRNDLFDDDLEVVLAEVKGGAPAARPAAKRKASATKVAAEQTAALELK